jgi:hypothetical protein
MIAYVARQNEKDNVWVLPLNGGVPQKLTGNSDPRLSLSSLAWSPDSRAIYFGKQTKQDELTDKFSVHLPANSEIKLELDPNTRKLTMISPWHPPEDLDPVFAANPELNFNHFVLLVGWDDKKGAWIIQNSWGDDWGFTCGHFGGGGEGKGYAYIRYGTFGQFAAWLEADLLAQKLLEANTIAQKPTAL